jgi:heme exporter protein C
MSGIFDNLANPTQFRNLSTVLRPFCFWSALACFSYGLYLSLVGSPADYQQGEAVRIMYVHVPSAWLGLSSYLGLGLCALFYLVWRHPLADVAARAIAPIGAGFTALTLLTGSLWGYPIWGTWWVWDARLTSMLVLLFFFIGYIALVTGFDRPERGSRMAAILALVGCVNLPIVKFSVDWWNTLHQPASLTRLDRPAIDPAMLTPLLLMALAFMAYFVTMLLIRMRADLNTARARALQLSAAD